MVISIKERLSYSRKEDSYTICLPRRHRVIATVTSSPAAVSSWLYHTRRIHSVRLRKLVVGLGVQWRPPGTRCQSRSKAATLQLCVGHRCLIFLLLRANYFPQPLSDFLGNTSITFVGISNFFDAEYLNTDHQLGVHALFDLRSRAAAFCGRPNLRRASLGKLAWVVLSMGGLGKNTAVGRSDWDAEKLSKDQVLYACVDAFISFEIGRVTRAWQLNYEVEGEE